MGNPTPPKQDARALSTPAPETEHRFCDRLTLAIGLAFLLSASGSLLDGPVGAAITTAVLEAAKWATS